MLTWNTSEVAKIQGIQYLEMIHVSLTVFHAPAKLSVPTLTWPAPRTVSQIGHLTLTCSAGLFPFPEFCMSLFFLFWWLMVHTV